jgi:putative transposase
MPYINAIFHLVWATRGRHPFLTDDIRNKVFDHIESNAHNKGIYLKAVNGYKDHIHCLVSLSCDQTISEIIQLIKGESSHWINQQKLTKSHFAWQEEYFAVSVSFSQIENVKLYIINQEEHHKKITWDQEYRKFITNYGFKL